MPVGVLLKMSYEEDTGVFAAEHSHVFNETLMEVIEKYPVVYDYHEKHYKNNGRRKVEWQKVTSEMADRGFPCNEDFCRKRFWFLVKRFREEMELENQPSRRSKPFLLYNKMSFLRPFMENKWRKTSMTFGESSESSTQEIETAHEGPNGRKRRRSENEVMGQGKKMTSVGMEHIDVVQPSSVEKRPYSDWYDSRWTHLLKALCPLTNQINDAGFNTFRLQLIPMALELIAKVMKEQLPSNS